MPIEIRNRFIGKVIHTVDSDTLIRADLIRADLRWADLIRADLRWADLSGADLSGADLSCADLSGADLSGADLSGADLSGADLSGADLSGASFNGTVGNMHEVVSAQFDTWPITAARMLDGTVTLQIGCQRHPLDMWRKSDPRWIAAMDSGAPAWWAKWRDVVLAVAGTLETFASPDN